MPSDKNQPAKEGATPTVPTAAENGQSHSNQGVANAAGNARSAARDDDRSGHSKRDAKAEARAERKGSKALSDGESSMQVGEEEFSPGGGMMLLMEGESEEESPVGYYRDRIEPGLDLPTLGAPAAYQTVDTIEYAESNDVLSPQIPGENEFIENVTTYSSTSDTETGTDETLGDYTREIEWTTELTRNGVDTSYTETRLKTYTIVTEYLDADGVESILTQTGTTTDYFELSTYVDPTTSESFTWTATTHGESDTYDFDQTWTTTETDVETGDVIVTTFGFSANGAQLFWMADGEAPGSSNQSLAVINYSAAQSESTSLGVSLATTSASGLSTATTSVGISGSFTWSLHAYRQQTAGGVNATNNDWMSSPVDYELEMVEGYQYDIFGQSTSSLTHVASGTEVVTRSTEVTPEGGGSPVSIDLTIDADVDFNYSLGTHDEFEFSLEGEDPAVGATVVVYDYADEGWLEESTFDDSAVTVTSESETGTVTLITDNSVDLETGVPASCCLKA